MCRNVTGGDRNPINYGFWVKWIFLHKEGQREAGEAGGRVLEPGWRLGGAWHLLLPDGGAGFEM